MRRLTLAIPVLALLAGCPKGGEAPTSAAPATTAAPAKGAGRIDPERVPPELKLKAANGWNGTYKNLLAVIEAPEDQASYSAFSEYGWKDAFPYKEYGPQPAGWWVYVAPYWFIWDTRNGQRQAEGPGALLPSDGQLPKAGPQTRNGLVDPDSLPVAVRFRAALGANAKYTNILAAIQDPDDAKSVSKFSEYGWRPTMSYKSYGQVPAGWWVYAEPYWVIWNLKDGKTGP